MASSLISIHGFVLFLILVQSVSLYKIYAADDDRSDSLRHWWPSPTDDDDDSSQELPSPYLGYDSDDVIPALPLSFASAMEREPMHKRASAVQLRSAKLLPQRRNNRPHWNPLVAAYKRCGELATREERESCFKDAVQMLFVHKLRK